MIDIQDILTTQEQHLEKQFTIKIDMDTNQLLDLAKSQLGTKKALNIVRRYIRAAVADALAQKTRAS